MLSASRLAAPNDKLDIGNRCRLAADQILHHIPEVGRMRMQKREKNLAKRA